MSSSSLLRVRTNAVRYLESYLRSVASDPYALSIITYALTLANSTQASIALRQLNDLAITEGIASTFISSSDSQCQHQTITVASFGDNIGQDKISGTYKFYCHNKFSRRLVDFLCITFRVGEQPIQNLERITIIGAPSTYFSYVAAFRNQNASDTTAV